MNPYVYCTMMSNCDDPEMKTMMIISGSMFVIVMAVGLLVGITELILKRIKNGRGTEDSDSDAGN